MYLPFFFVPLRILVRKATEHKPWAERVNSRIVIDVRDLATPVEEGIAHLAAFGPAYVDTRHATVGIPQDFLAFLSLQALGIKAFRHRAVFIVIRVEVVPVQGHELRRAPPFVQLVGPTCFIVQTHHDLHRFFDRDLDGVAILVKFWVAVFVQLYLFGFQCGCIAVSLVEQFLFIRVG